MRIETDNLGVSYGRQAALSGIALAAQPGEILGIIGPNGSGKSSLVKAIAGVVPCAGSLRFDGHAARPAVIGYMPQDYQAKAALSVLETVLLGRLGSLGLRVSSADLAAAEDVLCEVGIAHLALRDLGALSGGQRQLAFLGQALASDPRVLLLDEPFSALDIRHQLEVAALLTRLTRERHLTTILVLHDLAMAARLTDRIALLHEGRLIADGPSRAILASTEIRAAFGVEFATGLAADGRIEIRDMHLRLGR